MKLRLAKRAAQQIEQKDAWWAANRPASPTLFAIELRDMLDLIRTMPGSGIGWPTPRRPTLRRILMSRTHNHIFFAVDDATQTVVVFAIWGAARKHPPKL